MQNKQTKNVITVIMQKEFNTVKITENCLNELTSFSNIYWAQKMDLFGNLFNG